MIYSRAKNESQVHWHHEEGPLLLRNAIELLNGSGTALDIGCGTGVDSVFMAQRGLQVTAVDFVPRAIAFARNRAKEFGVDVDFIQRDVTDFQAEKKYDLIFDSGCLHSFDDEKRIRYKKQILALMSERCSYVLVHFAKRNKLDLGLGPKPKTRNQIEDFFKPELKLVDFQPETGGKPLYQYRFVDNSFDITAKNVSA